MLPNFLYEDLWADDQTITKYPDEILKYTTEYKEMEEYMSSKGYKPYSIMDLKLASVRAIGFIKEASMYLLDELERLIY